MRFLTPQPAFRFLLLLATSTLAIPVSGAAIHTLDARGEPARAVPAVAGQTELPGPQTAQAGEVRGFVAEAKPSVVPTSTSWLVASADFMRTPNAGAATDPRAAARATAGDAGDAGSPHWAGILSTVFLVAFFLGRRLS